jgi:CRP-like cAMP-binding protein
MQATHFKNLILRGLTSQAIARLRLRRVTFPVDYEFECPNGPIERIVFIEEGLALMTILFHNGSQVEVGMFGPESAIGLSRLLGVGRSLNSIAMGIAGWGYVALMDSAWREFHFGGQFHDLALRNVQMHLLQAMQSTACHAMHTTEQRLAQWLLLCRDRIQQDRVRILQESLGAMLGARRSSVSVVAGALQRDGLIAYRRGVIDILDAVGLEARSCECYRRPKDFMRTFEDFDAGIKAA